ncbi:hypothetical protein [Persephonella sp.]
MRGRRVELKRIDITKLLETLEQIVEDRKNKKEAQPLPALLYI